MSMSVGSQSRPTSHAYDVRALEQRARAGVAVELDDVVEQPPLEQHRVPGLAVVGRADREVAAAVVEHAGDHLRR